MSNGPDEPLDVPMILGNRFARLVTTSDGDVTALFVGRVAGASEVWVRLVNEEALLLEGGHSSRPAEILIGVRHCPELARRRLADVVRLSRAQSVHVERRADTFGTPLTGSRCRRGRGVERRWVQQVPACVNRRAPGSSGSRNEFTR
jgi:hypothetical protein